MEYGLRWRPGSSSLGRDHRSCTPHGYATSLQKYPVSRCEIRGRLTNRTSDQKNCSRKHFRVIRYCVRNVGLVVFRTYEAAEIALYHALGSLPMPQGTRKTGESASFNCPHLIIGTTNTLTHDITPATGTPLSPVACWAIREKCKPAPREMLPVKDYY